jgi:predicted MFS family arabinose efflux permease
MNPKARILLYANYLNFFGIAFFTPLFALFVDDIGAGPEMVGIAWAVNMYAAALMIILFGRYEDKIKNKEKVLVVGYFLMAAGAASYLLVSSLPELFAVQLFNAIGVGILTPAWRTVYAKSEDRGRETEEWAFMEGGNRFFIATGALIGGFILKYYSFKAIFVLMAVAQLIAAFIAMQLLTSKTTNK